MHNIYTCSCENAFQVIKSLSDSSHGDESRRQELVDIYENTITYAENISKMEDPILNELKTMYPEFDRDLNDHKLKAAETTAPVLVLGKLCGIDSLLTLVMLNKKMPHPVAQLDAPSDWRPGGCGFNPRPGRQYSFVEIDHEIFSTVILSLPLIQEGQLSVSGERMCTILVNSLED